MVNDDCIFHGILFKDDYSMYTCIALTHMECEGCVFFKNVKDYEWCKYYNPVGNQVPGVKKKGD